MKKAIDELKRLRSILSGITGLEDDDQEYIEDARKSVDRIIEALAKEPAPVQGWKLVPVKPTTEMLKVCDEDEGSKILDGAMFAGAVWSAFLAAAPQPAQPQQERMAWVYDTGKGYKIVGYNSAAIAHLDHGTLLVPNAPQPAQQEPVDSMGMPLSCGKPLCSPGDHHPLCKLAEQPAQRKPMIKQERDLIHAATGSMTFFKAVEHAISQTEEFHNIKAST